MPDSGYLLIVTADERLREELLSATTSLGDAAPSVVTVDSLREAAEAVRNREPALIVVEMEDDCSGLRNFTSEISETAPHAPVAAVFRPEANHGDRDESAVIIDALRAGVKDFLRRPVSSAELADLLARNRQPVQSAPRRQGKVISFISNKGGVGKSTLAVNTAVGLAMRRPGRVLLIDASLQMGVAASMLDVSPRVTLADAADEHGRLDETMLRQMVIQHESGLHLLAAPSDAVKAAAVDDEVISRIITLGRRAYDFVVVDTFPLFDRVVIAVLDLSDRTFVVLENVVPTITGAATLIEVLDGIGFPADRRKVVVNKMTKIAGTLSGDDVAEFLKCDIHAELPYDKRVIAAANTGRPYAMTARSAFSLWNRFPRELIRLIEGIDGLHVENGAPQNQPPAQTERQNPPSSGELQDE